MAITIETQDGPMECKAVRFVRGITLIFPNKVTHFQLNRNAAKILWGLLATDTRGRVDIPKGFKTDQDKNGLKIIPSLPGKVIHFDPHDSACLQFEMEKFAREE